jgi:hypothetical protein
LKPPSLDDQVVIFDNSVSLSSDSDHLAHDSGNSFDGGLECKPTEFAPPPSVTHPEHSSSTAHRETRSQTITFRIIYKQLGQALVPFPNDLSKILTNIPGPNYPVVSAHVQDRSPRIPLTNALPLLGFQDAARN